ncbi:Oxygen evolving enhancer protein 3 (PsbQ) [Musa troglodytarum]|uniref:Oxygen evolving enhancer protein 3 (PsbQ) n=1 Tax=Musa troglodytarum TaxID=320322 RepID=A0A9E7H3U0_9LILI|nr:Oxygen evolving enhancer protein 3 (PsbQ) [Musa troglodytarum]
MRWKGRVHRIRKCAVDLLSMEDDLIDAEEEDGWELTGSELRLKSTFLYCDLHRVISGAGEERKKALTLLADKLFYRLERVTRLLLFSVTTSVTRFWMKLSRAEASPGQTSATATQPMCCRN